MQGGRQKGQRAIALPKRDARPNALHALKGQHVTDALHATNDRAPLETRFRRLLPKKTPPERLFWEESVKSSPFALSNGKKNVKATPSGQNVWEENVKATLSGQSAWEEEVKAACS